MLDVLKRHPAVLNDPAPNFAVQESNESGDQWVPVAWSRIDSMRPSRGTELGFLRTLRFSSSPKSLRL